MKLYYFKKSKKLLTNFEEKNVRCCDQKMLLINILKFVYLISILGYGALIVGGTVLCALLVHFKQPKKSSIQ